MEKSYIILYNVPYHLEEEVNKLIEKGYRPLGNLVFLGSSNNELHSILAQAMWKEED